MKKGAVVGVFLCVSLLQIVTPLSMIAKRESVLKNGEQFKFKTVPVDPFDAFRGRYVALRIEEEKASIPEGSKLDHGQTVYALINVDGQGFANLGAVSTGKPRGKPYIQAKVKYISGGKAHLDLLIDRYYMEEGAAPKAEKIYLQHARRSKRNAYIIVRIKDGFAVVESLYVGDQRIEDAVRQE
ncbi:GDYXXLXY domain-containing protein [Candidatus Omnitrophota bacterium]